MTIATYHKRKLYIPKEVADTLELSDGDQAEIRILDEKSFKVSLKKSETAALEKGIINRILQRPFSSKLLVRHLKRKDFYDEDKS
ncbi:MAG: hypothetical protein ACRECH_03460 [Nitrososphaerales archaeon]